MSTHVPFVLEGYLTFRDAVLFVVERKISRRAALVAGGFARIFPDDRGESVARFAAHVLADHLAEGRVRAQFVCDVFGAVDIEPCWFSYARVEGLLADGRPGEGYAHANYVLRGHVVVEAASLGRALEADGRGAASWRERMTGGGQTGGAARPAPAARGQSGRPKKYDYEWLALEVANIFFNDRQPKTHAALIAMLLERYQAKFGETPDVSTLRPLVREAFRRLGLTEG